MSTKQKSVIENPTDKKTQLSSSLKAKSTNAEAETRQADVQDNALPGKVEVEEIPEVDTVTPPSSTIEVVSSMPETTQVKVATSAEIQPPPAKESPKPEINVEAIAAKYGLVVHEAATLFPMMPEEELVELGNGILNEGQKVKITTKDGVLLDGRNRLLACERVGVTPEFEEYEGDDPAALIHALNILRRNLTPKQRATSPSKTRVPSWRSTTCGAFLLGLMVRSITN